MRHLVLLLPLVACGSKSEQVPPVPDPVVEIDPIQRPPADPVVVDRAPAPPANAVPGPGGSKIISSGSYWFGTGPGFVYSCEGDRLRAWPKRGGDELDRGPCHGAFQFLGDHSGTYFCDSEGVKRIPAQGDPELVTAGESCILDAIDDTYVYYVIPGFDGIPNPGLYRVAKTGGDPTKLHATRKGEQIFAVVDGEQLWIGFWGAGMIARMPKSGGPLTTVVTGQRRMVDLQVDGDSLYWYRETDTNIQKRGKRGGATKTVATDIVQEPVVLHRGAMYWYRADEPGVTSMSLVRLAAGASTPTVLASGLESPTLTIDDEGIFFSEFGKPGIYMLPLPAN